MATKRSDTAADERRLAEEVARLALEQVAPDELVIFEETAAEYFADPRAALRPARADEAVGFGLDLALLTPYALAVAGPTVQFLLGSVRRALQAETDSAVAERVRRLLRRGGAAPVAEHEGVPPEIAREARRVAFTAGQSVGLDERTAALLADAVAGGLLVGT